MFARIFQPDEPANAQAPFTVADVFRWNSERPQRSRCAKANLERDRQINLFLDVYGMRPIFECRPADLLDFIESQPGVRSNWTRRRIKAIINRPFNQAANVGLIAKNPFAGLTIPEGPQGRDWTDAEYQAILRCSPPYFRRVIVFLRVSGARPGEARELNWKHVRDDIAAIVEREHKTSHVNDEPRRIYYNRVVTKLLAWLSRNKTHREHVFVNALGRPWSIAALCRRMRDIRAKAGVSDEVRCHGARHTFATNAIVNGVDLATLAELLGHKSVATTMRYLHLVNKKPHLNAAMEKAITRR